MKIPLNLNILNLDILLFNTNISPMVIKVNVSGNDINIYSFGIHLNHKIKCDLKI